MGRMTVLPSTAAPSGGIMRPRRIAVIGGGISGLAAAHRIGELDPTASITLFEASDRLGGALQTEQHDGWLIERSADMFTTREPWAIDLCRRLGIADELIETDARYRRAFIVRRGRLVPVPQGFMLMGPAKIWPVVTTPIFSVSGKLRLAREYFVPPRQEEIDESLESFAVRRFGREAFERLIQPLIGGIYTADPAKLSMAATMPQFVEMERQWGSVTRGIWAKGRGQERGDRGQQRAASGVRYGQFVAPRDGMQRLVDALAARLRPESIRLNTPVSHINRFNSQWHVMTPAAPETELFDDLIIATPAAVGSQLLRKVDDVLATLINYIRHAGCCVVVIGARRDQIGRPLDGFGFVVPAIEKRRIIACSMASVKFPGRAPCGKLLLRVFVGGALQPELNDLSDDDLRQVVMEELTQLIGLSGEPELCKIARWSDAMPQYHLEHLGLVQRIEERAAAIPSFALAGNAYRGVGIPFCVHSGEQAAERVCRAYSS
jgi:oxygen-dependent protoporphyrinogen oxidase